MSIPLDKFEAATRAIKQASDLVLETLRNETNRIGVSGINDESFNDYRRSLKNRSGIYAIFINNEITYVGKARTISDRLREHLVHQSSGTSSQLETIREHLSAGAKVEVSFVPVDTAIYSSIEENIIEMLKPNLLNRRAS